jgi:hypothetical protein
VPKIISPERLGSALREVLAQHTKLSKAKTDRAIKKAIIKTWGKIIKLTPVDTGRARGNWFVGTELSDKTGGEDKNKGASYVAKNIPKQIIGTTLYLFNNLDYIIPLEFGHSKKQAPKGMVRVSLLGWRKELQKQFKAEHT